MTTQAFFNREKQISVEEYKQAKNNLKIDIEKNFPQNDFFEVSLTLDLKQTFNDKALVECKVTTCGVFKKNSEMSEIELGNFCDINAAAIIFPFVREIVSNLSSKGGIQPIILQPINFVELKKQQP